MADVKAYWRNVREIAAKHDPEAFQRDREEEDPALRVNLRTSIVPVWLVSLDDPQTGSVPGRIFVMRPYAAAERLFSKTHRLATPDEIAAEEARNTIKHDEIVAEAIAAKNTVTTNTNVSVNTDGIVDAVVAAMQVVQDRKQPKPAKAEPVPA